MNRKIMYLVLLAAAVVFYTGCQQEPTPIEPPQLRPVRSIVVAATGFTRQATFSGVAVSGKESSLSFKVTGTVQTIFVDVGQRVVQGEQLARLDDTDFKVSYRSAVADLKNAEANAKSAETSVNTTRSSYLRVEKLYESGSVALSEFEQAKGNFEAAEAQLQAAQAQIATARSQLQATKNQLDYTVITAPFEGVINRILVEENEVVSSGVSILTLSDIGRPEINVGLSDRYIAQMKKNLDVKVVFPTISGRKFTGKINEISYAAGDDATYPVTILLDESSTLIRPGMAADVTFLFENGDTSTEKLFLPAEAVGEDGGGNFVFVIEEKGDGQGIVHRRAVTVGPLTTKGFEINDGLQIGERVATSGLQVLLENMAVKL